MAWCKDVRDIVLRSCNQLTAAETDPFNKFTSESQGRVDALSSSNLENETFAP